MLVFDPSFYTYAGTQQFSKSTQKQNGGLPLLGNNQSGTKTTNAFNILAYELSVPVIYAKGKMMLLATPSYIIPQNLITVPNRPDLSEKGEATFYATLSMKYTF